MYLVVEYMLKYIDIYMYVCFRFWVNFQYNKYENKKKYKFYNLNSMFD